MHRAAALDGPVEGEGFPLAEGIQRGYLSGAQPAVTYGRNEPALAHFHCSVRLDRP